VSDVVLANSFAQESIKVCGNDAPLPLIEPANAGVAAISTTDVASEMPASFERSFM
jgi:hypothetical protein